MPSAPEPTKGWYRHTDPATGYTALGVWHQVAEDGTLPPLVTRASILDQAKEYVHADRNSNYGDPEDNFEVIGEIMRAYLKRRFGRDIPLMSYDVANLMFAVKLGRLAHNPFHHDSYVDMAGYAAAGGEVAAKYGKDPEKSRLEED